MEEDTWSPVGRKAVKTNWPLTIELRSNPRPDAQRTYWVEGLDEKHLTIVKFPVSRLRGYDDYGVVADASNGEHTTPDGVTIHYDLPSWQNSSGKTMAGFPAVTIIRVERLLEYECLPKTPAGFSMVGCFEISVREWGTGLASEDTDEMEPTPSATEPGTRDRRLMPSFWISLPVPGAPEEGTAVLAVAYEDAYRYAPLARITGIGSITYQYEIPNARFIEGGGADSAESRPSRIRLGELFEADAMVGRRAILVADGTPKTTLVIARGWRREKETYNIDRIEKSYETCAYYSTGLDLSYAPPEFGRVRAADAFILPMVIGEDSLLVRRNPYRGWILDRNEVSVPHTSEWLVDIGSIRSLPEPKSWVGDRWDDEIRLSGRFR
jgi:hypothetical protein